MTKQLHKLFLLILATLFAAGSYAQDTEINGIYYDLDENDQTATVTYGDVQYTGSVEIPASITHNGKTYSVTTIGEDAFLYCSNLIAVSLPESVTSIGAGAFQNCRSLSAISIPKSVTSIEYVSFAGCSSLNSVTLPSSLTVIEAFAFLDCRSLTAISIPESVTSVEEGAFYGCTHLTAIHVSLDNAVYSSEDGILYDKDRTTLYACPGGKSGRFTVPSSVINIAEESFAGCVGLTEVTIPSSVARIGNEAFRGCGGLTTVSIPSSVISMGTNVFLFCNNLTAMQVSPENPVYCFEDGIMYNKDKTTLYFCLQGRTESVTIPSSVTRFEDYAFYGCSNLTDVTVPFSVKSIGKYAFKWCI